MIVIDSTQSDKPYDTASMKWLLFKVDGIDANKKFDGTSWTQMGITAPTTTGTLGEQGSGSLSNTWSYAYTYYNSNTGHESNGLTIGTITLTSATSTVISGLPASSDSQVTHKKIYRTLESGGVFFYLKTITNATTSTTDNATDASIDTALTLATDNGLPAKARYCIAHKGRLFLAGDGQEKRGTIHVRTGYNTATGNTTGTDQTYFRSGMAGKYISVANSATRYLISSVNSATQQIVLDTAYAGATSTSTFLISGRPTMVCFSEADRPEAFSDTYDLGIEGDEITGLGEAQDDIFIFTRKRIYRWRYTTDPDPVDGDGELEHVNPTVGCLGNKTIINAENTLFFANEHGIFALGARAGTVNSYDVSDLTFPIRDRWKDHVDKTNFERFHGVFRRQTNDLMWWVYEDIYANAGFQVPDAQKIYPNTLYVFNLDSKTWTRHQNIIASCSVRYIDRYGDEHIAFSDGLGVVHEWGYNEYDGYSLSLATVTTSNTLTSTLSGVTLPVTGSKLIGVPVRIESGTGADQIRRIINNTTATITVETAWTTTPTTSSRVSFGAPYTTWRSKMEDMGTTDHTKLWKKFHLSFRTATATGTTIRVRFLSGANLTAILPTASYAGDGVTITSGDQWHVVDATYSEGNVVIEVGANSRYMTVEFDCHQPGKPVEILGFSWDVTGRVDK